MMRIQNAATCALGALTAATLSFGLAGQTPQTDPEIEALKTKVEALEASVKTLEAFVEAQATAGKTLVDSLTRSEAEGFTAGINPRSREILLEGLRTQAEAMQAGAGDEEEEETPKSGRGRRRGR